MGTNYSPSIVKDGLVMYLDAGNKKSYPGSGTNWADLSKFNNNGTLINGPTFDAANGGSIVSNGTTGYIRVLHNDSITPSTLITTSIWIKFYAFKTDYGFLCKSFYNSSSDNGGYSLGVESTNTLYFSIWNNGRVSAAMATSNFVLDTWYNFVGTYDGSNLRLYQNGIIQSTQPGVTSIKSNATNLSIGSQIGTYAVSSFFISNTQIYNRALTQAEITQNYNALKGRYLI